MNNTGCATRTIFHNETFIASNRQKVDKQIRAYALQRSTPMLSVAYVNQIDRVIAHAEFTNNYKRGGAHA